MKTLTIKDNQSIRALEPDELCEVNGGFLPALGAAAALASHIGVGGAATSVAGHYLSGFALGYAVYSAASYYGGGGSGIGKKSQINSQ